MAAPESEFIQKRLRHFISESDIRIARIGVRDGTDAVLKERYYLDFIRPITEYDPNNLANEIPSKSGFIGGVIVGSDNYYMHNQNRMWSVAYLTASNERVFNDAGKNTKAPIELTDWTTTFANRMRAKLLSVSAWHVNTGSYGFQYKLQTSSIWSANIPLSNPSRYPQRAIINVTELLAG